VRVRDQYTSPDRRVDSRASSSVVVVVVVRLHPSWRRGQRAGDWGGVGCPFTIGRWVHGKPHSHRNKTTFATFAGSSRAIDRHRCRCRDVEMSIDRSIAPSRRIPEDAGGGRAWRQRATTVGASTQTVTTPPRTRTSVLICKLAHTRRRRGRGRDERATTSRGSEKDEGV
jgi:hypothetical protein